MDEDLGDWGLLSIADILDTEATRKDELPSGTVVSLSDLDIPLLSCEPSYITRYVQLLIANLKCASAYRISNLEELDASRSARLRRSLTALGVIREKLLGAVETFVLTVRHEPQSPGFLRTVVLLGSLVCSQASSFSDAVINSMEVTALRTDHSPDAISSCLDVIQSFKSRVDMTLLTAEQRGRFARAEFSLALRSERLSAIISCLLQKFASEGFHEGYRPPPMQLRANYVKTKSDGFLTRLCELPYSTYTSSLYCTSRDESLFVCGKNRLCVFDQLGMMGTRFRLKHQFQHTLKSNTRVIYCDEKMLLIVDREQSTMGSASYTIEMRDCRSGAVLQSSQIIFNFDDVPAAACDVLFSICENVLFCLVCSESSRLPNSKCYLLKAEVDATLSRRVSTFRVSPQNALKRGPCTLSTGRKCYYFTKVNPIMIGRLSLKESFHPFTIEMWVYPCNTHENQTVVSFGDKNFDEIAIEIEPTLEGVLWRGGSRTPHLGASFVSFSVPGKLAFSHRWWHVALLFTGCSWELWINDGIVAHAPALVSPEAISDVKCSLGKSFVGCLTEVRIWKCYRSPSQLYRDGRRSLTGREAFLCGYYVLDEGTGEVIADHATGGCHAILHHGQAVWTDVADFPVAPPQTPRHIDDFAPISWRESSGSLFISSSPGYLALGMIADGPSLVVCEYALHNLQLVSQVRIDLPSRMALKGISYNVSQQSLICYTSSPEQPRGLIIWELHQQHHFHLRKEYYRSIWECEKDLLSQCSAYAKRFVGVERCTVDQLSWSIRVPRLVVDVSDGLIENLLKLVQVVLVEHKNHDHAYELCTLLCVNLLYRVENNREGLRNEIGDPFPDAQSLINASQCCGDPPNARVALLRLAFQESFFDTGLLSVTCRCLLSDKSRLAFIKSQAGRGRLTEKEDMLFHCLLQFYESIKVTSSLVSTAECAQLFCTSLMGEELFQVDRWLSGHNQAINAVRRTSRCIEVFQETLLANVVEKPRGECGGYIASYAELLLRTSEKLMEAFLKAIRTKPYLYSSGLNTCMEYSIVGALLPSFTVALSLLPTSVQASCVSSFKGCREALFSLAEAVPGNDQIPYKLVVALTSALCRIGCSLLVSSDVVTGHLETKYLQLMSCGIRKAGSERDAIIRSLQQGVGHISKVLGELHRDDPGALLVLRDERLMKLERLLMAAFCALLLPTEFLRQATKQSLAPVFRYIHNMRPLVLSKRQEDPRALDVLEQRALFLARFEPVCGSTGTTAALHIRRGLKDANPQRRWKRFFQTWKTLRVLKTMLPPRTDADTSSVGAAIVHFLQDRSVDRESLDRIVLQQTQRACYRLSGMLLLKQLLEEAKASDTLGKIVLPVLAKAFTGWHYADDVQCCLKEDLLRLQGLFFQLLELVVGTMKSEEQSEWADVFLALLTSELRVLDFGESYALQSEEGVLFEGHTLGRPIGCTFAIGDVMGCGWNTEKREVYWTKNGKDIVATVHVVQRQLYPLIGMSGKGLIKVNFGRDRFVFDRLKTHKVPKLDLGERAWDVFRVFSLRAALSLVEFSGGSSSSHESLEDLRTCFRHCLECMCLELERTIAFPMSEAFVMHLCSHLATLAKVLVPARSEVLTLSVQHVTSVLQRATHHVLRNDGCSSKLRCALITVWCAFMDLAPPQAITEDKQLPGFLDTLLSLGMELECIVLRSTARSGTACTVTEAWTALALLQHMNSHSPRHLWSGELHTWIMQNTENAKDIARTSLALRIMLGGGRLVVPGDQVTLQKSKHTRVPATVVDYSLEDELCEVIENGEKHQTVSLRKVEITQGDDVSLFPLPNDDLHALQVNQVFKLAELLWDGREAENIPTPTALRCKLLAIMWCCARKGFRVPPVKFVPFLTRFLDDMESQTDGRQALLKERLVVEYCLLSKTLNGRDSGHTDVGSCGGPSNVVDGEFASEVGHSGAANARETRIRLAQELSMHGYSLDLCFMALVETDNDLPAALQLLGDHHEDFISSRRRTASSSSEEDEMSTEDGELDPAEYDTHAIFSPESDDGIYEDVSLDQCDPLNDGIRFLGGYVCIRSEEPLSNTFTIDFQLYLCDVTVMQDVLYQKASKGDWQLVACIQSSSFYCGWMKSGDTVPSLCRATIDLSDTLRWVQFTLVQDGTKFFLYKCGVFQSEVEMLHHGSLFEDVIYVGGCPDSEDTRLNGGIKDVRIFGTPMTREEVESFAATRLDDECLHLVLRLECTGDTIKAVSTNQGAVAGVTVVGAVTWFEHPTGYGRTNDVCCQEIDFTTQNNEDGIFVVDTLGDARSFTTTWLRRKDQRIDQVVTAIQKLDKQLACYYAVAILAHMMRSPSECEMHLTQEQVHRMVRFAVSCNDADILEAYTAALHRLCEGEDTSIVSYALEELVSIVQREQKMLVLESSHPFKSASETAHEVYVPGRKEYELHFDVRCSSSMLVTFYADHTLCSVIAQVPGYALGPFCIRAPRFFFDVRMDVSATQWGYKVNVLYDLSVMRLAARLLRSTLSAVIARGHISVSYLRTRECFSGLVNATGTNVAATRRLVLSCLTDLLHYISDYSESMPQMARMHDLRRMSERLFRQSIGSKHLQSRFVQLVSEFYVALKNATQCLGVAVEEREGISDKPYDAAADVDCFQQKRLQQRQLYKQREGLRVTVEKVLHTESLRVGVNPNKTILAWSELSGSALVADVQLGQGRWYFEVRIMATGDVFIGVRPSRLTDRGEARATESFVAFNGKTGTFHGVRDPAVPPRRIWKVKDYVGVVMDGAQKTCSFFVNGQDTGVFFYFGVNESEATGAAGADVVDEQEVVYHPFFALDEEEGITINFGGAHFEYEVPRNCFPLDPANLTLGTLIPYNQLQAFHDLAAYIVSSGGTTLPPFFHEEANPFEGSTERFGPPHVSLTCTAGVQVSLLLARNTGVRFSTVKANCSVSGGRWYYEVTLRSQGLMQIGWRSSADPQDASVGDTPCSWSVDLFRRAKWHNGKSEPLTSSKRWAVGDVIGCALDLVEKKMIFLFNGRLICDSTLCDCTFSDLPSGLSYEPAVSLRSGAELVFNFGSSSLRHKPEGFCALGVPDSWNERIDTFYSTLRPSTTLLRIRALRSLSLSAGRLSTHGTLVFCEQIVEVVDRYFRQNSKCFAQMTEGACRKIFADSSVPEKVWEMYQVLVAFSRVAQSVLPFLHLDTRHPNITTKLFLACRTFIFASIRNELVDDIVRETNVRCEHFRISINRMKARAKNNTWTSSVFGQTFSLVADQNPRIFRTNKRFWSVMFLGEGSEDVGGPFREHIGEMCRELMSTALPLFVPTANNVHNTGSYRDAFVPAASATGASELSAFVFVGQLMGGALRSNEPLSFFFPPLVWKFLCFYPIVESDIDDVDRICLQCIREFRSLRAHVGSGDMFDEVFDTETFTTRLSDGSIKELIPGGSTTRVTFERCEEYANAVSAARVAEFTLQLEKMREGLLNVVPETVLCLLTPSELEWRVCGKPDYSVAELREGAVYEGLMSDDRRVQFLWQALEEATTLQRRLFLRFVSGRDRLPVKLRILPLTTSGDADSVLPRAATCFFALELPDYSSLEILKAKLYYSIENCVDIDTDFNPQEVD
uniref:Putative ubiquitin-protein ligase n=1 Tax=Trypanosoma vivax (strain Y486) TaxID=1055687 RepID=G0U7C2_TRYVY|nr:putative ubiquitin-protein ligase, fragment [Trypanosoma vivax Y486]